MLTLSLLGKPTIILPGSKAAATVAEFGTTKVQALLFYLAITGQPHSREALAELLWGEDDAEKARRSLRTALAALTKRLPDHFAVDRDAIAFRQDQPHSLDLAEIQRLATTLDAPVPDPEQLQRAAALYRGAFLEDFHVVDAPAFEAWLVSEREYWQNLTLDLLTALGEIHLSNRQYADAVTVAETFLEIEPWDEEIHRLLMTAHSRMGNFNQALVQYERCRALLAAELDVPPMPATETLAERIQNARQARTHNLPADAIPFVGRVTALVQLANLLDNPAARLITIIGLGGIGKTRLALEAAAVANQEQALQFLNGVIWVPLAGIEHSSSIPPAIANALGIALGGRTDPTRELLAYLRNKELLLVLDNLEHLMDATPLLQAILREAPDVKLLVTSRRPLAIDAEWRLDLEGLSFPDAAAREQRLDQAPDDAWEAIALFVQMAQQVQPTFALTMQTRPHVEMLCQLVAGVPLALKLASIWLRLMPLERVVTEVAQNLDLLATRLRDLPPRQRSMRVVYDYTWSLLTVEQQEVLAALSVFHGGWDEEAAQAVAGATPEILAQLVDRFLIQMDVVGVTVRYSMHELTRQYATEQMTDPGEVFNAHSQHFAQIVQRVYTQFLSNNHPYSLGQLVQETDNLLIAWEWLIDQIPSTLNSDFAIATLQQFVNPFAWYYQERSLYRHGVQHFHAACVQLANAMAQAEGKRALALQTLRAQIIINLAIFHYSLGNYDTIEERIQAILPTLQATGEQALEAAALEVLGRAYYRRGQNHEAKTLLAQSIRYCQAVGDRFGEMLATSTLAYTLANEGNYSAAIDLQEQVVAYYRAIQYDVGVARLLTNLASTYERQGEPAVARPLLEEALPIAERHNHRFLRMFSTSNFASVLSALGEQEVAERKREESLALAKEMDDQYWVATNYNGLSRIYLRMGKIERAGNAARQAFAVAAAIRGEPALLSSIGYLAQVWAQQGQIEAGLRGLLYLHHHPSALAWDRDLTAPLLAELRAELPATVLAEAERWSESHSLEEATAWFRGIIDNNERELLPGDRC